MNEAFWLLSSECEPQEEDGEACAGDEASAAGAAVDAGFLRGPRHLRWLIG